MRSVEQALDVLELLSRSEDELGIREIEAATGLAGATLARISGPREYEVPLPVTATEAKGRGDRDHSAILTFIEDLAQHRDRGRGLPGPSRKE